MRNRWRERIMGIVDISGWTETATITRHRMG